MSIFRFAHVLVEEVLDVVNPLTPEREALRQSYVQSSGDVWEPVALGSDG